MLFSPTSLTECVREWEDLEKNYQQIQVNLTGLQVYFCLA